MIDPQLNLQPDDEHNRLLAENVHPPEWQNPTPDGRYNLVVLGAGTAGLVAGRRRRRYGREGCAGRKTTDGRWTASMSAASHRRRSSASAHAAHDVRTAGRFGVRVTGAGRGRFPGGDGAHAPHSHRHLAQRLGETILGALRDRRLLRNRSIHRSRHCRREWHEPEVRQGRDRHRSPRRRSADPGPRRSRLSHQPQCLQPHRAAAPPGGGRRWANRFRARPGPSPDWVPRSRSSRWRTSSSSERTGMRPRFFRPRWSVTESPSVYRPRLEKVETSPDGRVLFLDTPDGAQRVTVDEILVGVGRTTQRRGSRSRSGGRRVRP